MMLKKPVAPWQRAQPTVEAQEEAVARIAKAVDAFDPTGAKAIRVAHNVEDERTSSPTCSATNCDWQMECAWKGKYGQNPEVCPFRS